MYRHRIREQFGITLRIDFAATLEETPTPNEGKSQLNVGLLAGVGSLGFILVIAVVLLVVFLRRRRPVNEYIDVQSRTRILNSTTTQEFLGDGFYDSENGYIKLNTCLSRK